MITCKEDLIGTYILNDCGELRSMYIKKALELGLSVNSACLTTSSDLIFTKSQSAGFGMVDHAITIEHLEKNYGTQREVTLMDLKPTKFVKVEGSIFDLKEELERGELFTKKAWGEYVLIKEDTHLALLYEMQSRENSKIGIYRQVEIDWRDELDSYLDSISSLDSNFDEKVTLEFSKSKFSYNMSDSEFVAACHLVASLTDKPE